MSLLNVQNESQNFPLILRYHNMNTDEIIASSRVRRSERIRSRQHLQRGTRLQRQPDALREPDVIPNTVPALTSSSGDIEIVAEDDLCAICQLMLYRPVKMHCNHTLCEACMAHWADVSVTTQMKIVDVDEEVVDFNPISGLEARCPMCRTQTAAELDDDRSRQLMSKYPRTWSERQAEDEPEDQSILGAVHTLTLHIGNRHKEVAPTRGESNMHEWNFFVKPSRLDIIKEVRIELVSPLPLQTNRHQTSSDDKIVCSKQGAFLQNNDPNVS